MALNNGCSIIRDNKIQGTDIFIGSEEWRFYLRYTNETFIYYYEELEIHCCRNGGDSWCAYPPNAKIKFHLGTENNITVQRMEEIGQKILDRLTSPGSNEKK